MAKNTREGAQQTEAAIYQTIIDIFMEEGWDAVTYGSIAKRTGLSRSGIQRVVPTKESMTDAFQGQVFSYVVGLIDDSSHRSIKLSWQAALNEPKFVHCIKYLINAINEHSGGKKKATLGLQRLMDLLGQQITVELLGMSVAHLLDVDMVWDDSQLG
ncbi:TetR/AcrR family transcriptional regulator [Enterovibrio calviensis]|uniref:TetR/AcrR family transcriptional regulator n=1 Tax=Enterovibrio calviensis TaxID=91359 RepID=UPI0004850485|nr:TetR/AcrR family transcriptional regulator [Enterovibrio calviensis]